MADSASSGTLLTCNVRLCKHQGEALHPDLMAKMLLKGSIF